MSHDIQNKLIQIMANKFTLDITANIRNNFDSIIFDEYTDMSNKEQLSLFIPWVDYFHVTHEEFFGFY